jgi:hypothetical protein
MQADPLAEWQRLTQLYREMGDGVLEELDADKGDLTEVAQQVLGDEIRKRGLDKPSGPSNETDASKRFGISPWSRNGDSSAAEDTTEESNLPVEYTWKAPLCECEDSEKVRQVQEVLRRAGIESWIEGPGYSVALEMSSPRIEVAADQLEQAREIISRPIPQEIVEQSKLPAEEYVPPVCPSCGADEPILESVEPVNAWRCESCGKQWSEQVEEKESSTQ